MSEDKPLAEEELVRRAKASLESYPVSDDVLRKLRHARAQAVEKAAQTERPESLLERWRDRDRWLLLPVGALGALGLAWMMGDQAATPGIPVLDEQEFAAMTEMELLEEIEFVAWMMEQSDGAEPDEG